MEFELEPQKLMTMFKSILVPELKNFGQSGIIATPDELFVKMIYDAFGVMAIYKKEFFISYECEEEENFNIDIKMLDSLKMGFSERKITVKNKDDNIVFSDKKDRLVSTIPILTTPIYQKEVSITKYGAMVKDMKKSFDVILQVSTGDIITSKDEAQIEINVKGNIKKDIKTLTLTSKIEVEGVGNTLSRSAEVLAIKAPKGDIDFTIYYDMLFLRAALKNMPEKIYILLGSDEGPMAIATQSDVHYITYLMAPLDSSEDEDDEEEMDSDEDEMEEEMED